MLRISYAGVSFNGSANRRFMIVGNDLFGPRIEVALTDTEAIDLYKSLGLLLRSVGLIPNG